LQNDGRLDISGGRTPASAHGDGTARSTIGYRIDSPGSRSVRGRYRRSAGSVNEFHDVQRAGATDGSE
jgi:hypothetical protein